MKQSVNNYEFHRAFETMRPDNFSYEGLNLLFESLEELEESTGEEFELDVIAICCDFSESTPDEIAQDYGLDLTDCNNKTDTVVSFLENESFVVGTTEQGTIVYQQF